MASIAMPKHSPWPFVLIGLAAGALMISGESLWIDEAQTAAYAMKPTFAQWLDTLLNDRNSESQMPLAMFVAWLAGSVIGTGEWALRAVNLPWIALAALVIARTGQITRTPWLLPLFLLHPFVWYYANEARPYALQICAGALLLYALARTHAEQPIGRSVFALLGLACVVGYSAHLLFAFVLAAALPAIGWRLHQRGALAPAFRSVAAWLSLLGLAALTLYYLWTLRQGAGGAKIWQVSGFNLAYAFYELLGFVGLGPPRNILRELGRSPGGVLDLLAQPRYIFGLLLLCLLYGWVGMRLWRSRCEPLLRSVAAIIAAGTILLAGASWAMAFPFWGRHMSALFPFVLFMVAHALPSPALDAERRSQWAMAAMCGLLAYSTLCVRFAQGFRKDDYRAASAQARRALDAGGSVWWAASGQAAAYYGLGTERSGWNVLSSPAASELTSLPAPDLILCSKPDIFDAQGGLRTYLQRGGYVETNRLTGFSVWRKGS